MRFGGVMSILLMLIIAATITLYFLETKQVTDFVKVLPLTTCGTGTTLNSESYQCEVTNTAQQQQTDSSAQQVPQTTTYTASGTQQ